MSDGNSAKKSKNRGLWTLLIVFGGLFAIFAVFAVMVLGSFSQGAKGNNQIGVVEITGPIMSSEKAVATLKHFNEQDEIEGILVRIDSPGGAVGASQEIMEAVKASEKKVVISMGNIAASGGFYIACAGETTKVFANSGTITGSIGVITQTFEVDALMDYLQLKVNTVTSGEFKDSGSPFRDFSPKDRKHYEELVLDIYNQFVDAVVEGRKLPREKVLPWADGRVFTGRQAKEAGLVDELGGMQAAVQWLADDLGLEGETTLIYPPRDAESLLETLVEQGVSAVEGGVGALTTPSFEYRYKGPFAK